MRIVGIFALAIGAIVSSMASAAPVEPRVVSCAPGPVMIGSGKPTWRRESVVAGPLGIRRHPLHDMSPYSPTKPNVLVTKAPILVDGSDPVTLRVPPALAGRVFLYYGFHQGPAGKRSTSFYGFPGSSAIEFRPCTDKPRTVWPGGLRIKGRAPVHLDVTVEGNPTPISLPLGRPGVRP
ncbi:MAG TPA: hypothetical protein VFN89_11515 [Solirubrobacterales bacterium]|nr:hypothetical protein [Solirubrobacterales bacterium]